MPIMDKFIRTPDINGIVPSGIDSGEGDNSVTLISSSAGSSSEPKSNQSTVSPARSSSAPKGNQSIVSPVGSSSVTRGNQSIVSPARSSSAPKGNQSTVSPAKSSNVPKDSQSIVSPARSSSAPKGNQSTVTPVGSSSVARGNKPSKSIVSPVGGSSAPRGNGSPGLGTKAVRGVKKIFGVRAEGSKKKEPEESVVLSENLTSMRPLRSAQTMTIEKIQQRLNSLIKGDFPIRLIGLISANHETINKEINSGQNSEIIDLVDKAANVKATSQGKTAYQMAVDKDNKEFLEVKDNEEFLKVVDNAREKKKVSSVSQEATEHSPKKRQTVPQSVAPRVTKLNRHKSKTLNDLTEENLTIEEIRLELECFINNKSSGDILNLISNNYWVIRRAINLSNTRIMELILQTAAIKSQKLEEVEDVEREEVEGAELEEDPEIKNTNIDKEQSDMVFQEEAQRALDKLVELRKKYESFLRLTYIPEIEEIHAKQEIRSVKSCPDLTTLGSAPSVEEGGKNTGLVWLDGNGLQSSGDENAFSSIFKIVNPEKKPLNLSLSPVESSLHDSDTDSGMGGSPKSSPKKKGMKSPQSNRRNSLLSNTGSDTEEEGIEPKLQEEFLPAAKLLPLLNKERPKGPSGRRASSRRLRNHEDRTQEPTPVVIPASTTRVTLPLQEKEPTPVVTPVLDTGTQEEQDRLIPASTTRVTLPLLAVIPARNAGIQKEQKQILVLATRVTLPPQEGEPVPDAAKAPNQVTEEPKVIEKKKKKENIFPVEQKPANNRNFYIAATAICTLGAVACFAIAGFMSAKKTELATLSVVAIVVLCAIGIGLAAAAKITWNSIPPPLSELTSTDSTRQAAKGDDKLNIGYL